MAFIYKMEIKPLEYYFDDGSHIIFDKYNIDAYGIIRNAKTGQMLSYRHTGKYAACNVRYNGKKHCVYVGRAVVSTFCGKPDTFRHTADHIDRNPTNDNLENLWLCKRGQRANQERPHTYKTAFLIVRDGIEKTAREWVIHLQEEKNIHGREYTVNIIAMYAIKKQYGFSYKNYPDLPGEVWKHIINSGNTRNHWEISNMNRVKYVKKNAENVLTASSLRLTNDGYPCIAINQKQYFCHVLAFQAFYPDKYTDRKPNEMILHEDDDKTDFRPHKLRLGTSSENSHDAYKNGKHNDTKSARMICISYIGDTFEKKHESQHDAVKYLLSIGYTKACVSSITRAIKAYKDGKMSIRYGRSWKLM